MAQIIPYIFYLDVEAALSFLHRAFGFQRTMKVATPSDGIHAEMEFDGQAIMLGQRALPTATEESTALGREATMGVFIYLDDVDAHYGRAAAAGAQIDQTPNDVSYGRTYSARDPEGHPWYFTTRLAP